MLLSTDWEKNYGLPTNLIKGFLPVSGLFDLKPFPFSWLQPKLLLTSEQVLRNSPVFLKPLYSPHVWSQLAQMNRMNFSGNRKIILLFCKNTEFLQNIYLCLEKTHFNIIHDFLGDGGQLCKKIIEWK